ncbi:MAG: ParB/RepB/Spo0J family partition protein [Eubacteriales bacterium]|nr:ParB/RepB/Spo0J family partition protein [Eubacteriales bacterium]
MAVRKTGGLGRGLDALIPAKASAEKEAVKKTQAETKTEKKTVPVAAEKKVKISSVEPNRSQPRKHFDEDALLELAESIKQYGVLQPLLVSDKKGYYEIIAGERRWRAAKIAGLKEVPVIVKEFTEQEVVEISLIENIQREDLNPIEEAMAYKRLLDEFHLKQDEIAERVAKSRTAVTNSMRLLKLDEKVQQMLIDEMISAGHARAILALPDKEQQASVATKVFDEKMSVRETEKLVKTLMEPPREKNVEKNTTEDAVYESLEEKMKAIMGTKVVINRKKNNKGKIEIEYYSRDELERIIELFESIR